MKPTLINQTVAQQSIMYRLDYLASQLPSKDMAIALGRQTGRATRFMRLQSLMLEIQLTHQQLANSMNSEVKS
ncbi:hypothetical protein [Psychrobacter sp.]|uniref:hypothetical protein n=1 Tax=Psychrobacter sp. TaxID=56811 RepID=UPI002FD95374